MNPLRWTLALLAIGLFSLPGTGRAQYAPGKGSLGGTLGMPMLYSTSELRAGQRPRIMGKAHFQYVLDPRWRLSLRFGFGWLGYTNDVPAPFPLQAYNQPYPFNATRVDQLDTFIPVTATMTYVRNLGASGSWKGFAGAGLGVYRVNLLNDRHTLFDPVTHNRFLFWSPGLGGEIGAEYFIPANRSVSLEGVGTIHYLLDRNREAFPSGYNGRYGFFDISFGVNVYFTPPGGKKGAAPAGEAKPAPPAGASEGTPAKPETPPETPPPPPTP